MYLTDEQLVSRLAEFQFLADDGDNPFDPGEQIGPCSVDLRLSGTYWTPRRGRLAPFGRRRVVDLERTRVMDLSPQRGWKPHRAQLNDKITIRPGQMILARVAERFHMPSDCAGAIEGRSSYARLGLSVHTAGGFVNPGWKGHMPLTLYNHSPVILKLPVGTPVCQLLVVSLAQAPGADYAVRADRKYLNDQGGPSLWWRDDIMKKIRESFGKVNLDSHAFDELEDLMSDEPDEGVLARLEDHLAGQGNRSYGNADELLRDFAKRERWRRLGVLTSLSVARAAWTVVGGWLLSLFLAPNVSLWTWIIAGTLMTLSVIALAWGVLNRTPFYLTPDELTRAGLRRDKRSMSANPAPT